MHLFIRNYYIKFLKNVQFTLIHLTLEEVYCASGACIPLLTWKWTPHLWGLPQCKWEKTYNRYIVYFLLRFCVLCPNSKRFVFLSQHWMYHVVIHILKRGMDPLLVHLSPDVQCGNKVHIVFYLYQTSPGTKNLVQSNYRVLFGNLSLLDKV